MSGKDDTPEILKWRKQKVYRCRLCAFDSLDKARFEDHFTKAHPPLRVIDGGKRGPEKTVATEKKESSNGNASS